MVEHANLAKNQVYSTLEMGCIAHQWDVKEI
jgi:hypothetical protein